MMEGRRMRFTGIAFKPPLAAEIKYCGSERKGKGYCKVSSMY
jgi:hypothetical protein